MAVWNPTKSCPSSKSEYVSRGPSFGCQEGREYHCLMDHNGSPGEICVPRTWVEPGNCPEYNIDAWKLDVYLCNENYGACPQAIYWSNTSFQYGGCMHIKTTETNTTEISTVSADHSSSNLILVVPAVLAIVAVILLITAIWMYRRRKSSRKGGRFHLEEMHDSRHNEKVLLLEIEEHMFHTGKIALEEHNQDTTYVPTQGFMWTTEVMLTHNVAVISGIVGSGKTKTALHTASTWNKEDEHRRLILIESINEIPDVLQRKLDTVIIIMDDCFTRWTLECTEGSLSSTCTELYRRVCHSNNVKLIITIDYNIYQRHKQWLSHMDLFKEHLIITLPIEMASPTDFTLKRCNIKELLQKDGKMILQSHIKNQNTQENQYITDETKPQTHIAFKDKDILNIISRDYVDVGFPSICAMFVRLYEKAELKSDLLQFCDTRIKDLVEDTLIGNLMASLSKGEKEKQQKRCILSYAMLRDKCIDLDELDFGLLNKLGERYKFESYDLQTVIPIVKELSKTFLIQTKKGIFKIPHTAMYNKHLKHWIQQRPHDCLKLCNITLIKEIIRPGGYKSKSGEVIFVVKKAAHIEQLAQRFKELLPMYPELKHHPMMSSKGFQREMEKDGQRRNDGNTYEEIKHSGADPEKRETGGRSTVTPPPPHPPRCLLKT